MRIIAGSLRGFNIEAPKGDNTRPTLDRVREALFSILTLELLNARVLDLFSGSGAFSIEAISRGAKTALLNDLSNDAIKAIINNIKLTKLEKYVKISKKDYKKCIKNLFKTEEKYDIIFLDPPYMSNFGEEAIKQLSEFDLLSEDGIIVFETDIRHEFPREIGNFKVTNEKSYGRVVLSFWKRKG